MAEGIKLVLARVASKQCRIRVLRTHVCVLIPEKTAESITHIWRAKFKFHVGDESDTRITGIKTTNDSVLCDMRRGRRVVNLVTADSIIEIWRKGR